MRFENVIPKKEMETKTPKIGSQNELNQSGSCLDLRASFWAIIALRVTWVTARQKLKYSNRNSNREDNVVTCPQKPSLSLSLIKRICNSAWIVSLLKQWVRIWVYSDYCGLKGKFSQSLCSEPSHLFHYSPSPPHIFSSSMALCTDLARFQGELIFSPFFLRNLILMTAGHIGIPIVQRGQKYILSKFPFHEDVIHLCTFSPFPLRLSLSLSFTNLPPVSFTGSGLPCCHSHGHRLEPD